MKSEAHETEKEREREYEHEALVYSLPSFVNLLFRGLCTISALSSLNFQMRKYRRDSLDKTDHNYGTKNHLLG